MVDDREVRAAARRLADAGIPSPDHDARALAQFARESERDFAELVERRAAREPLQHLVGSVGFRYIELEVGRGVFVPRPESEVVAGIAIDLAKQFDAPTVVDFCSGSGTIALSVANEVPDVRVVAVEMDPVAHEWLERNAKARHAAGDPLVDVRLGPVTGALPELDGQVDVVVSNPPYVAEHEIAQVDPEVRDHDPRVALVAGPDGLDVIREVAEAAWRLLQPGGWLVVEHSDRQGESAPAALVEQGFVGVADHVDLTDRPRCAVGRRP